MKINCNVSWKGEEEISLKTFDFTSDLKVTNVRLGLGITLSFKPELMGLVVPLVETKRDWGHMGFRWNMMSWGFFVCV